MYSNPTIGDKVRLIDGVEYAGIVPGGTGFVTGVSNSISFSVNGYEGCNPRFWALVDSLSEREELTRDVNKGFASLKRLTELYPTEFQGMRDELRRALGGE